MIQRFAVRALLLAEPERLLLAKIQLPDYDRAIWIAPGGGIEAGEEPEECLVREVREETGFVLTKWSGPVWKRRHVFELQGETYDQRETFYLVRTRYFEPNHDGNPAEIEQKLFRGFRWWTLQEIKASKEIFVPRRIAKHTEDLIRLGCPEVPIEVEV